MPKKPEHLVDSASLREVGTKLVRYGNALIAYADAMDNAEPPIEGFTATNGGQRDKSVAYAERYVDIIHKKISDITNPTRL